ncbi:MAG: type II toxin-antitoxin system prevent-host-death family antitoxin [Gemmatimonadota bacterium]
MTMSDIGVAELKAKLSEYLRAVRRGQEVTVMDRDTPIARLVPYAPSGPLVVREPVSRYRSLADIALPPRPGMTIDPVELLLEDRRGDE